MKFLKFILLISYLFYTISANYNCDYEENCYCNESQVYFEIGCYEFEYSEKTHLYQ